MATMITEVYTAFRAAGVPEADAQSAAQAISDTMKSDLATKVDIADVRTELADAKIEIIKWVIGIGFAQAAFVVGLLKLLP